MKKVATRKNRFKKNTFIETNWTKKSKNLGEYIFRRISLDQSNKELQEIRPRHILSGLIINSKEIQQYVCDYLALLECKGNYDNVNDLSMKDLNKIDLNYINKNIHVS
jgi:hypothetical protein